MASVLALLLLPWSIWSAAPSSRNLAFLIFLRGSLAMYACCWEPPVGLPATLGSSPCAPICTGYRHSVCPWFPRESRRPSRLPAGRAGQSGPPAAAAARGRHRRGSRLPRLQSPPVRVQTDLLPRRPSSWCPRAAAPAQPPALPPRPLLAAPAPLSGAPVRGPAGCPQKSHRSPRPAAPGPRAGSGWVRGAWRPSWAAAWSAPPAVPQRMGGGKRGGMRAPVGPGGVAARRRTRGLALSSLPFFRPCPGLPGDCTGEAALVTTAAAAAAAAGAVGGEGSACCCCALPGLPTVLRTTASKRPRCLSRSTSMSTLRRVGIHTAAAGQRDATGPRHTRPKGLTWSRPRSSSGAGRSAGRS